MQSQKRINTALAAIAASLLFLAGPFTNGGRAFVDGPPPATTGGFGEENCRKCHFDFELNDATGSLRLEGLPESYSPGELYTITIHLAHPKLERGGFEIAARFAAGEKTGNQAGSLESIDERTTIVSDKDGSIQYARHTRTGSAPPAKGAMNWSIRWRAPVGPAGTVVFNAAANAANFDESPLGDYPYTFEFKTRPAGVIPRR
jgi:hypothetical protein